MPVKDLIQASKKAPADRAILPAKAMADLREVLKANDAEPNHKCRVSADAFCTYLRTEYKISITPQTLKRVVARELDRPWSSAGRQ